MASGIYTITNTVTGKVYVGSAVHIKRRFDRHRAELRHGNHCNLHLLRAWKQHGETCFVFAVVELSCERMLIEREQYWIDRLNAAKSGYNIAPVAGSTAGRKMAPEHQAAITAALRGRKQPRTAEWQQKLTAAQIGRRATPETIVKISEAGKRLVPPSEEARARMSGAQKRRAPRSMQTRLKLSKCWTFRRPLVFTPEYRANPRAGQARRRAREKAVPCGGEHATA